MRTLKRAEGLSQASVRRGRQKPDAWGLHLQSGKVASKKPPRDLSLARI